MAVLSDDKSVFGDSVPSIYIKKVTVENSGFVPNPRLMDRIVAHVDNKAATGELGADDSEKYYEQSNYSTTTTGNSLKITVDYLIKDGLDGTLGQLVSTWSDKEDLQDYTIVGTMLVDDELAAKILSVGSNINFLEQPAELLFYSLLPLIQYNILSEEDKQKLIGIGLQSGSFNTPNQGPLLKAGITQSEVSDRLYDLLRKSVVQKQGLLLKNIVQEALNSVYVEVDDTGKKIKNYQFSATYEYKTDNPDSLFVVSGCSLAMSSLSEAFNFDLDMTFVTQNGIPTGRKATQQIFQNGSIASANNAYLLKSNSAIWTGQVYQVGSKFYTKPNVADGKELVKKSVQNNKVQDFRITERIEKLKFNLSFLQTDSISLAEANKVSRDKTDIFKQPAYFTKNYISRDFSGNARFMFGVDFYSLVRDLTNFGSVLPKQVNKENYLQSRKLSQILDLSIKRKRVDVVPRSNRLGTLHKAEVPFKTGYLGEPHIDVEEVVSTIAAGSEQLTNAGIGTFSASPSSNINGLQETSFRIPDQGLQTGDSGFRFFNVDDQQIKNFTDGKYQYGVELSILDRSNDYIIAKAVDLISAYKLVSQYYNEAMTPNKYYNPRTGNFRQLLSNYYATQTFKPWESAINTLTAIIKEFKADEDAFDESDFKSQMNLICHPNTGSPRGIETLQKLILNAASKMAEIAGTALNRSTLSELASGSTKAVSKSSVLSKAPEKRIIKIEYWLEEIFDTEVPKEFGYDFLAHAGISSAGVGKGLRNINGQQFNTRLKSEMLKFFTVENPSSFVVTNLEEGIAFTPNDTIYESLFSYLSPSVINLGANLPGGDTSNISGKKSYSLLDGSTPFAGSGNTGTNPFYDKKGYSYVASKIMNYNINAVLPPYDTTTQGSSNFTLLSQTIDKIKYHTQQILTKRNCVAVLDNVLETATTAPDFTGLFMSDFLGEEIDQADPLENNNIKLDDLISDPLKINYKGGAEVSTFLAFIYGYGNQCGGITSTKAPAPTTNKKQSGFDLNFFTPTSAGTVAVNEKPPNVIAKIRQILLESGDNTALTLNSQEGVINPSIQSRIKALPNQIKSLMLQENGDARVRHKWSNITGDNPSQNVYYKAAFAFNYTNLKQVEYLAGFATSSPGTGMLISAPSNPMIRRPIWKVLDADIYTAAINKNLFCRLKTYSKPEFGIVPLDCLDMPVLDEYFTLQPKSFDGSFIPAEPVQSLPDTGIAVQDEQPSEYTDSFINIPKPTNEQKKQMNVNAITTGGSNPNNPVKEGLPQMSGFLGGNAGGPPVETTTGKNLSKI